MDLNRLIQMLMRMFMRKAVNKGIRKATDYASRRNGPSSEAMTPEEREHARRMKDLTDRAKKTARLGRRL